MTGLFDDESELSASPLAQRARPQRISEFFGLARLLEQHASLHVALYESRVFHIVLYGPPGVGKTTLARLIAKQRDEDMVELSATTASTKDLKELYRRARTMQSQGYGPTLCFIDEIHRFTKVQQDALLAPLEEGAFSFIGASTENPYVSLTPALLSRLRCIELTPLADEELHDLLIRAARLEHVELSDSFIDKVTTLCGGDARAAIGAIEETASVRRKREVLPSDGPTLLDETDIDENVLVLGGGQSKSSHYELTSALIKSMRASDLESSLYYLARLLIENEDPRFIARRLAIFAIEDIGPINNQALAVANATYSLIEKVGMPEGRYLLAHCVMYLSTSPKSTEVKHHLKEALDRAARTRTEPVPSHLRGSITEIEDRYR